MGHSLPNILMMIFGLVSASQEQGNPILLGSTFSSPASPRSSCSPFQPVLWDKEKALISSDRVDHCSRPGGTWLCPSAYEFTEPCARPGADIQSLCKCSSRDAHTGQAKMYIFPINSQGPICNPARSPSASSHCSCQVRCHGYSPAPWFCSTTPVEHPVLRIRPLPV